MNKTKYSTFTEQALHAARLLYAHKTTAIKLALLPLVPFAFTVPYLVELNNFNQNGVAPALRGMTLLFFIVAVVAIVTFLVLCEIVKVGMYAVFSTQHNIGARKALQIGTKRFPAFLFTEVVLAIFIFISLLPVLILNFWSGAVGKEWLAQFIPLAAAELLLLILAAVFLIPAFVVGIWLSFAQLLAATDNKSGLTALTSSVTLVRPNFQEIALRLVGWTIFVVIATYVVSPLPLANWLIPALLMLMGVAYLVVLYQETANRKSTDLSAETGKISLPRRKIGISRKKAASA